MLGTKIQERETIDMENRQNGQNGQRPPVGCGGRFWHIWGPFIINWGIGIVVGILAGIAFLGAYIAAHTKEFMASQGDQEALMNIYNKMMEVVLQHTTEIEGVTALITIPVMLFLYCRDRNREKVYGVIPNKKAPAAKYIMVVIMAGTLSLAMNNLIIIGNLSSYSESYEQTATALYSASMGMQILCLGILAPIAEELVFRGLMYRRMREDTGFVAAVIYSAAVFGLFHGNLVQMIYGTVMGLMLAYVCEKYGSVLAPIIAHITANLISILATYFKVYEWMLSNIMLIGMITVACATITAMVFQVMQKMDEKPEKAGEN